MQNLNHFKTIIPVNQCVPGMILLQPIVDIETGNTLVGRNQELTLETIHYIKKFKHTEVWVAVENEKKIWQVEPKTLIAYKRYIQVLRDILGNKQEDTEIDLGEIEALAKCITREFECNFNLLACVNLVKNMDKDIYMHSVNVAFLSILIARWIDYDVSKLKDIAMAALLHDIGKMEVSCKIRGISHHFNIGDKLEFRRHPIYSYEELIKYPDIGDNVLKAVLTHHERCDGSGYPLNLTGEHIGDIGKIIGLADEYDLIRRNKNIFQIIKILKDDKLKEFDIPMLLEFCNNVINYYIGMNVLLSTGEVGEVIFIQPHALHRPIIKVDQKYINLYEQPKIEIIKII